MEMVPPVDSTATPRPRSRDGGKAADDDDALPLPPRPLHAPEAHALQPAARHASPAGASATGLIVVGPCSCRSAPCGSSARHGDAAASAPDTGGALAMTRKAKAGQALKGKGQGREGEAREGGAMSAGQGK